MRFPGGPAIVGRSALDIVAPPRASLYVDRAGSPGHSLREDFFRKPAPVSIARVLIARPAPGRALHSVTNTGKHTYVMPQNNNKRAPRPFRASTDAPARKAGSKSPKHRGYRPGEAAVAPARAKKPRWNSEERVARGVPGERPR